MGRYTQAKCRLCRREGAKLFLKGVRCVTEKCPFVKRPNPPGTYNRFSGKASYYSMQLREKQKVKRMYGMMEMQFRRFFRIAARSRGVTGQKLVECLERRLDNVVYRSLLASSRNQARQLTLHGFFYVNGRRVNVPSFLVKAGDAITLKKSENVRKTAQGNIQASAKDRSVPSWIELDKDNLKINIVRLPEREDLITPINEQLIIELYSK